MTYREVLIMRKNLDEVNPIEGVNVKFLYAVSKNKEKLDSIIKHLDGLKKPSDEINEFWKKLDELNTKYAEVDETGTVVYSTAMVNGEPRKAYKKVIGEGNPDSKYTKEVEKLREKHKKAIDAYEEAIRRYNTMLDNELEEDGCDKGTYRKHMIDLDIVPAGLHPKAMDGCLPFIKDEELAETKPPDDKTKKQK